jgi:DNA-binding NtrC family response regulator
MRCAMSEERGKVRCQKCELVQWSDREKCRRCGAPLPQLVVKIVERVVERVVFQPPAGNNTGSVTVPTLSETGAMTDFPTMAQMERKMILAAYQRSNRRPLLAARLLGIGKTTMYRKLREMKRAA